MRELVQLCSQDQACINSCARQLAVWWLTSLLRPQVGKKNKKYFTFFTKSFKFQKLLLWDYQTVWCLVFWPSVLSLTLHISTADISQKSKKVLLCSQVNSVLDHSCRSIWLAASVCLSVCMQVRVSVWFFLSRREPDGRECLVKWD